MADMKPPPPYTPDPAAPSSVAEPKAYWIYWGASFATLVTWIFAVSAAADDAWLSWGGISTLSLGEECLAEGKFCDLYKAGTAFQFMATIIISVALVVIIAAAFMPPPKTGKLGLVAGVLLVVFSVFELIAFSVMAALVEESGNLYFTNFKAGPTLGVAVVAWLLGVAGAILVLLFRSRATTDTEGPFRKYIQQSQGGGAMNSGSGPQVGTV